MENLKSMRLSVRRDHEEVTEPENALQPALRARKRKVEDKIYEMALSQQQKRYKSDDRSFLLQGKVLISPISSSSFLNF